MRPDYSTNRYPTKAQSHLHIGNLYATALLKGYRPADVETARVLEIGCGDGMNLIPMACSLPQARFVGVDYALAPVESAREVASTLTLKNFHCHHADICEMADDFGEFDYIIAHGFYSWAPEDARDALWRVAGGSLAPNGMLFVSYNVLPGWRQTAMLRDFIQLEKRRFQDEPDALNQVWESVSFLASFKETSHPLAIQAARSVAKGLDTSIHDEFQLETRAFHLKEVLDSGTAAGFRYVGDAVHKVRSGLQADTRVADFLDEIAGDDFALREQYLDVMTLRPFRQSIFALDSHSPDSRSFDERVEQLHVSTAIRVSEPNQNGQRLFEGSFNGQSKDDLRFESEDPVAAWLFAHLAERFPANAPVGETIRQAFQQNPQWEPPVQQEFWKLFEELVEAGAFNLSPLPLPLPEPAKLRHDARHRVSALNRLEAGLGRDITTRLHTTLPIRDPLHRALLLLLDGTRTTEEIVGALAHAIQMQQTSGAEFANIGVVGLPLLASGAFQRHPQALASATSLEHFLLMLVPAELDRYRDWAILEPEMPDAAIESNPA